MTTKTMDGDMYLDNLESRELPSYLIEKALALTGKTMDDMSELTPQGYTIMFSLEKFLWYLLSPEFIDKYAEKYATYIQNEWNSNPDNIQVLHTKPYEKQCVLRIGNAIYEYQLNNPKPLISLLEKIG